jgi:hypothetical protein
LVPVSLENVSDGCKGVFLIGVPSNKFLALNMSSIVGKVEFTFEFCTPLLPIVINNA